MTNKEILDLDGKFNYLPSVIAKAKESEFEPSQKESKISVRPYRPVLPGHIWIGIEEKDPK